MIAKKSLVAGEQKLIKLQSAREALAAAETAKTDAEVSWQAMREAVYIRFRHYCYEILPKFVTRGQSFWMAGEHAGEYRLSVHDREWTWNGEWLVVHPIGYTRKGQPLKSNGWTTQEFNPAYIAKMALKEPPKPEIESVATGAPP